jgi:hypothetical protein
MLAAMKPNARSRKYTPEEVEKALLALALVGGNSGEASRRLKGANIEISPRLLRLWRSGLHARRYAELAQEYAREVEETIVQEARETAILAAEVERLALAKTLEQLEAGEIRDAAAAARNAATVKGINVDKLLTLSGRPNQIIEQSNPDEILAHLIRDGIFQLAGDAEPQQVASGEVLAIDLPEDAVAELSGILASVES